MRKVGWVATPELPLDPPTKTAMYCTCNPCLLVRVIDHDSLLNNLSCIRNIMFNTWCYHIQLKLILSNCIVKRIYATPFLLYMYYMYYEKFDIVLFVARDYLQRLIWVTAAGKLHVEFPISNESQLKFYECLVYYALISNFCRLVHNAIFLLVTYKIVSGTCRIFHKLLFILNLLKSHVINVNFNKAKGYHAITSI